MRRTRKGIGIAHADKEHIFHRLMDIGHGHRQTVLLMYLWSALVCGSALAIGVIDGWLVAGIIVGCAMVLFLATALPRLLERRRNGDANGTTDEDGSADTTESPPTVVRLATSSQRRNRRRARHPPTREPGSPAATTRAVRQHVKSFTSGPGQVVRNGL